MIDFLLSCIYRATTSINPPTIVQGAKLVRFCTFCGGYAKIIKSFLFYVVQSTIYVTNKLRIKSPLRGCRIQIIS